MLSVSGTRDYAEPPVESHHEAYLYDDCPCGKRKRKTSRLCAECKEKHRDEQIYLERCKEAIRALVRRAYRGDKVKIFVEAPPECDLPAVMTEVVAEVMG